MKQTKIQAFKRFKHLVFGGWRGRAQSRLHEIINAISDVICQKGMSVENKTELLGALEGGGANKELSGVDSVVQGRRHNEDNA